MKFGKTILLIALVCTLIEVSIEVLIEVVDHSSINKRQDVETGNINIIS